MIQRGCRAEVRLSSYPVSGCGGQRTFSVGGSALQLFTRRFSLSQEPHTLDPSNIKMYIFLTTNIFIPKLQNHFVAMNIVNSFITKKKTSKGNYPGIYYSIRISKVLGSLETK